MKINKFLTLLCFLPAFAFAQQTVPISKTEVLEKVSQQNRKLKIGEQEMLSARGDFNQTRAVFLPNINASHSAMGTTNPLMAFGFKLNQETVTPADFDPSKLNNPSQINMYATKFEVQQPIINVDGIYQRKAAKAKWEATQMQLARTGDYLSLETEKAYMQLQLAYKSVAVLETALNAAEENFRLANNSFKQGYLQQSDVLAVQVRVTEIENQLQYAKSNVINASEYLEVLMNEDVEGVLKPTDSLTIASELVTIENSLDSRADIKAMEFAAEAYRQNHNADKMTFLPRLNAFGSYELYDDQIFQGDANGYLFGAALTWNIFEGSKRFGKMQKSKAEYNKASFELEQYKSESKLEIHKAERMFTDAKNNLRLTEMALEQSEEALRIRKNRFKEGLERTTDLLMAETQFSQKQLEYFNTVFQHNYALAYLQFLTKN
ncbi:TolC family protein [Aequorivita viscosa]|uniref:Outer membrane protein TolC n=1 Tax=Aequorivita viscosa TaxID=797419 RepID=A0A1M6NXM3_9FLAO|nr:TolC family protein [Aequorivita viscosa]SDX49534.1 Outer membrane protein TolC [Aequorivita viscosa]SHK00391.1 Outer membrane protein TolC [Aequorivita viscosa]